MGFLGHGVVPPTQHGSVGPVVVVGPVGMVPIVLELAPGKAEGNLHDGGMESTRLAGIEINHIDQLSSMAGQENVGAGNLGKDRFGRIRS